jgi:hypothetical protein
MKVLPIAIVVMVILLGIHQAGEADRLATRERELNRRARHTAESHGTGDEDRRTGSTTKAVKLDRSGKRDFDAGSYIGKFKSLFAIAMQRDTLPEEERFIQEDLLDASVDEILLLPQMMRDAGLPDEAAMFLNESTSVRLLDRDPALACEHAIKGGDLENFRLVVRTWISSDPVKAAEWLEMRGKADPPLDEKTLAAYGGNAPLDLPGLVDAARIAAAPSSADLGRIITLEGTDLDRRMEDVLQVMSADNLPVFLRRLSDEGREDLVELAMAKHPDPHLARDYLKQVDLPPSSFTKIAEAAVARLDPADLPRGLEWFLENTEPGLRGDSLDRLVESWTQENPQSVARWIERQAPGEDRDRALRAHREALANPLPRH